MVIVDACDISIYLTTWRNGHHHCLGHPHQCHPFRHSSNRCDSKFQICYWTFESTYRTMVCYLYFYYYHYSDGLIRHSWSRRCYQEMIVVGWKSLTDTIDYRENLWNCCCCCCCYNYYHGDDSRTTMTTMDRSMRVLDGSSWKDGGWYNNYHHPKVPGHNNNNSRALSRSNERIACFNLRRHSLSNGGCGQEPAISTVTEDFPFWQQCFQCGEADGVGSREWLMFRWIDILEVTSLSFTQLVPVRLFVALFRFPMYSNSVVTQLLLSRSSFNLTTI